MKEYAMGALERESAPDRSSDTPVSARAREEAVASREDAVSAREAADDAREHALAVREAADRAREEAAAMREEALRAREEAARARSELSVLMDQIREANEYLVIANLRSQVLAEDAERANHLKDEFLAVVSHEVRTPLNAVIGWARMLASKQLPEQRVTHAVQAIERNAASLAVLVDDLLDVSRIVAGTLTVTSRPLDLIAVTQAACDVVRTAAAAKRLHLSVAFDDSAALIVKGDPGRLQQVIGNLLANAVKFTPEGGRVDVSVRRVGTDVEVCVADTGEGIPAEFLPHVFERFRQADGSSSRRHGGLGLGLAIVRQLVELHGGTVHAASPGAGQGSTFTIRLPLVDADAPADRPSGIAAGQQAPPLDSAPRRAARLGHLNVLVVDGDADGRALTSLVLKEEGARVSAVGSAREALQVLEEERPEVLVTAIGLPDEDGYALVARLRQREAEQGGFVPAIALTGYARTEDRTRVLSAGFQAHVPKPLDPAELTSAVAAVVGRS